MQTRHLKKILKRSDTLKRISFDQARAAILELAVVGPYSHTGTWKLADTLTKIRVPYVGPYKDIGGNTWQLSIAWHVCFASIEVVGVSQMAMSAFEQ